MHPTASEAGPHRPGRARQTLTLLAVGLLLTWSLRAWFARTPPALLAVPLLSADGPSWVWFPEGDPARAAPVGTRHFRRDFRLDLPVTAASLQITADDRFTVWVNGVRVGGGDDCRRCYRFDVRSHLRVGDNVLAVAAENLGGPAGLLARLAYVREGHAQETLTSDESWKAAPTASAGWQGPGFDDTAWQPVRVLGRHGEVGPWKDLAWDSGEGRFRVPPGFRVEPALGTSTAGAALSLLNLTFDDQGRLLVAQEGGPVLLCAAPGPDGIYTRVKPYCTRVLSCHGMCWVGDALLLVGEGPQGQGLYRARGEEVTLLQGFTTSVHAEHGPHAILHGPDDHLYLVLGNGAWVHPNPLAANSPLRRWPGGQRTPVYGEPGSTEDTLLPPLPDFTGHQDDLRSPAGTIWRLDRQGRNLALVSAGLRNTFDAAFDHRGELFTLDSDTEREEGLPWYRPVRLCHCPPGGDFLYRQSSANGPPWYLDGLPPVQEVGRGSPVGMTFYEHTAFPARYRGACFMADWSMGLIYAVHFRRHGATYRATLERFCQGVPMNVTDVAVGPDGALYFTMGGRGSAGGVYRIVYTGATQTQTPSGVDEILDAPQPLAAWSRPRWQVASNADGMGAELLRAARDPARPLRQRLRALEGLHARGGDVAVLLADREPEVRAHVVWLLGLRGGVNAALVRRLRDEDALVRRRACEALVRAGFAPPLDALWPLLADPDRFVRTAARLVLQRLPAQRWAGKLWRERDDRIVLEGVVALCRTNQAAGHAGPVFERLRRVSALQGELLVDYLRTLQLAILHAGDHGRANAAPLAKRFLHPDRQANRELAILLAHWGRTGQLDGVHTRLLEALRASGSDREQQIHYFCCLRLLRKGWTAPQRRELLAWYDEARTWPGGSSFATYLDFIFTDLAPIFTAEDRTWALSEARRLPRAAAALLRAARPAEVPPAELLAGAHERHSDSAELRSAIREALGRSRETGAAVVLARLSEAEGKAQQPPPPAESHRLPDLLAYLESPAGRVGDVERGRAVFKKARCLDCHRHGRAGGDMGPDLSTVARRFSRRYILEAIVEPSKDIAPQYRATTLVTSRGVTLTGLVTPRKGVLSVLQADGARVTVREKDVEERFPSSVSLMPEGLLHSLRREEIRDLFAFLESPPN